MSDTKAADLSPDFSVFAGEYDIVGELDSSEQRVYIANRLGDDARRRGDERGVHITIVRTPAGDEANALTQYAADTKALIGLQHRRLVPVLDGRWVGDDAFAVVTPRITDPTLTQKLALGEPFHSTRIAAILREVSGLLEWAREQKIVHRRVTPDNIFLEPKTDRVRVQFMPTAIKRLHQPGVHDDARTIARLAIAMLGGDPEMQICDADSLNELRPNLPQAFCKVTSNLLDPQQTPTSADIASYLALIGMADPLVEGETERDRIRAEIIEEQRVEREKLATERATFEAEMATARTNFDKLMEEERAKLEKERLELQKLATKEREELQKALAAERAALTARREELEKTVAEQVAQLERTAARDRAEIERLKAEIRAAGDAEVEKKRAAALDEIDPEEESVVDDEEYVPAELALPMLAPLPPLVFDDETSVLNKEPIEFRTHRPEPVALASADAGDVIRGTPGATQKTRLIAAALAGLFLLVGGGAIALNSRRASSRPAPAPVAERSAPRATAPGAVAARRAPAATVAFTADPVASRAWLDSVRRSDPVDIDWAVAMEEARQRRAARARIAAIAAGTVVPSAPEGGAAVPATGTGGTAGESTRRTNAARRARTLADSVFNFREEPAPPAPSRDSVRPVEPKPDPVTPPVTPPATPPSTPPSTPPGTPPG